MAKKGNIGIYLAGPTNRSTKRVEKAILRVLETSSGDEVKKAAINAIVSSMTPPVSISNCKVGGFD